MGFQRLGEAEVHPVAADLDAYPLGMPDGQSVSRRRTGGREPCEDEQHH